MKITIVGAAGSVGAPAAFHLAAQGLADDIVMIGGKRRNVLQQHAMDLATAFSAKDIRVRAGDHPDMAGSDIVINTAGSAPGPIQDRMELLPKTLPLVRNIAGAIKRYCPEAIVITVTNPVDPLNYATWRAGGFHREKLLGYSINDSFRFREMLAREYGAKVSSVKGTVIGEHGSSQVLLFSTAMIDGRAIPVANEIKETIYAEIPHILKRYEELKAGRTAGWTCAVGLAQIIRAIAEDRNEVLPCSVVLNGEYGLTDLSMSVPVTLGRTGVKRVHEVELAEDEQEKFKETVRVLKSAMAFVDDRLR